MSWSFDDARGGLPSQVNVRRNATTGFVGAGSLRDAIHTAIGLL